MNGLPKPKLVKLTYEDNRGRLPEHRFYSYQYRIIADYLSQYGKAYIKVLRDKSSFVHSPKDFPKKPKSMLTVIGMDVG